MSAIRRDYAVSCDDLTFEQAMAWLREQVKSEPFKHCTSGEVSARFDGRSHWTAVISGRTEEWTDTPPAAAGGDQ